jgi:alpha-L-fucosidase 2
LFGHFFKELTQCFSSVQESFTYPGPFELDMQWTDGQITQVEVLSKKGQSCRIDPKTKVTITADDKPVKYKTLKDGSIEFKTQAGRTYTLIRSKH